ncbi:MAG: rod shape-determining protein RodA [Actinomycetota bacterium]|jgi:rod shape determining protein RodA|nr:rod shape-determining protein RodA [Actinomycetota bacterium]
MSSLTGTTNAPAGNLGRLRSLDPMLLFVTLALSVFGIVAVYVAGVDDRQGYAANQAIGFVVGLAGAIPLALIDYRFWLRHLKVIYIAVIVMLLAVTVIGAAAGGAQRWIEIGPVQIQPSEFAKLMMVVVLAGYFADRAIGETGPFMKSLGVLAIPGLLVFVQPDLGTSLVFGAVFVTMAFIGGAKIWQLAAIAGGVVASAFAAIRFGILEEYQVARLTAFINPENSGDVGYQVVQSKMAIGSGGLMGKGLEARTLATGGYLPEDHTDFIFANLAERIGFAGSILLIVLFFLLIWRILHIATISRDRFGVLIAVGVATIFLFHVFVNIGMTMGIMPVTGIPLPFVSYGRSSLVVSVISLGLLQSVAMRSRSDMSKSPRP